VILYLRGSNANNLERNAKDFDGDCQNAKYFTFVAYTSKIFSIRGLFGVRAPTQTLKFLTAVLRD
jgi:hypothetical protein